MPTTSSSPSSSSPATPSSSSPSSPSSSSPATPSSSSPSSSSLPSVSSSSPSSPSSSSPSSPSSSSPSSPSSSSSSSVKPVVTLTASETTIDYGKLTLPSWKNIEHFKGQVDRLEEINDRLKELSEIPPEEVNQAEVDEIQTLSEEVKQLADDIAAMPLDLAAGSAPPAKSPINLSLSSNPSNLAGLIKKRAEHITATRPGAPPATLGVYANLSGTTTFVGTLTLNGSYGTATLYGTAGGVSSNVVTITVTGQTRQDAEKELQALLDKLTDQENRLVSAFAALSGTLASLTTLLVAVAAIAAGGPLGVALVLVGAVAALGFAAYAMNQVELIHQRFRQLRRDAEDAARPLINSLPSTR